MMHWKGHITSAGFPKIYNLNLNMRKYQTQIGGHSTKPLSSKVVKVIKDEEKLKNCHRLGGGVTKEE